MRVRRPHRIAGDAFGSDVLTAPALNRVIQAKDDIAGWGKARDQQSQ
jgi:hypothetical protein